jgi:hypothetical protein
MIQNKEKLLSKKIPKNVKEMKKEGILRVISPPALDSIPIPSSLDESTDYLGFLKIFPPSLLSPATKVKPS